MADIDNNDNIIDEEDLNFEDQNTEENPTTEELFESGEAGIIETPEDERLEEEAAADIPQEASPAYKVPGASDKKHQLSGMFKNWYLEYASYVILERAVPHIEDGLKPVQRRILHTMQTLDDGRFNKVANIVGSTMSYHPHGDASIGDALVQLGQKEMLIDTQGNWGNILTGDSAAAPRYIEARLSELALEILFSPKITEWQPSYDGRKKEPVTLPAKFPLLLAQGVEGIAVGLNSKILPHNFNEIAEAAISYLQKKPFSLFPDFQTGGLMDASRYNDGARGGQIKVRAKIEKIDNKTLAIREIPFGKTTATLIDTILKAMEKGKIKVRKVDDNTSANAEIIVHLAPGASSDKTIDALYSFTDCEVSISPNCCVIWDKKPRFLTVSDVLKFSTDRTQAILHRELEIKLEEALESQLFASLEKIFIEERMYKDAEIERAADMDAALNRLSELFEPFKASFFREINHDDYMRLWEIKMGRILKFNSEKADEKIALLDKQIADLRNNLEHIVDYTIGWFTHLKEKYGHAFPRRTVLRGFDSIVATKVAEANKRLYFDKEGGFIGTGLKDAEFKFTCSDIDDVLVVYRDGTYKISKVQEKLYVGKKVIHVGLFKKNDKRTIYNVIYRNGKGGIYYKKRFFITGLTRDKEYNMTKGEPGSRIEWMTVNPNGEAETVKVLLKDEPGPDGRRPRNREVMVDFAALDIKGKESLGNLVTKFNIQSATLDKKGTSTLGGRDVWFDRDVLRLNYDGRGEYLGSFLGEDLVLVITKDGEFYTTSFSEENHYEDNILKIEKFIKGKVWTLALFDAELGYPYLKRFEFEPSKNPQRFVGNGPESRILLLSDTPYPRFQVTFGGNDSVRPELEIDAEEFIGVKGFKAKGKRITTFQLGEITELEPLRKPEPSEPAETETIENPEDDSDVSDLPEQPDSSEKPQIIEPTLFDEV
ncbi:MAG: DNA gyrase/topoisomerase IV subunit A [Muribaculaceae bacterium]|nr:DNA gyrase/topoisomerase IV subunit A [Muribaculaceae bacterium]